MSTEAPAGMGRRAGAGLLLAASAAVLLATGGWAAVRGGLLHRPAASPTTPAVPTGTVTIIRGTVTARQLVPGVLGYAGSLTVVAPATGETGAAGPIPADAAAPTGTITALPAPGTVVRRGQPLYEVDGHPVPLWYGRRPAWRAFRPTMADGSDVRQLEANLVALGFDRGRAVTVDGHFSAATAAAVRRWQRAAGRAPTGVIGPGEIAFLPEAVRVASVAAALGAPVQPGAAILAATSTRPVITVSLDPTLQQLVHPRSGVAVTLPDGATTRGSVTAISRAATTVDGGTDQGQSQGGGNTRPTIAVTVSLADPRAASGLDQAPVQVAITVEEHRGVLTVPVTALLARSGGGYDVELLAGAADRRVPVQTGLFDEASGVVEVTGPGLAAGSRVEVPAP
jgi:hypothetical protein